MISCISLQWSEMSVNYKKISCLLLLHLVDWRSAFVDNIYIILRCFSIWHVSSLFFWLVNVLLGKLRNSISNSVVDQWGHKDKCLFLFRNKYFFVRRFGKYDPGWVYYLSRSSTWNRIRHWWHVRWWAWKSWTWMRGNNTVFDIKTMDVTFANNKLRRMGRS